MPTKADRQLQHNIAAHDRFAALYDTAHDEIFNAVEQARLHESLQRAADAVSTTSDPKRALDFGCGTGNLTRHLLDLDLHVVAADVSSRFLQMIEERWADTGRCQTHRLNGKDLADLGDASFDLVAAYSVLHHIPDYLAAVRELVGVTKRGGVIYLDHENSPANWEPGTDLRTFRRLAKEAQADRPRRRSWLSRKILRLRRAFNPRYHPEGDIHVWPDDHIEWDRIEALLAEANCEIVFREDYLLCKAHYPQDLYEQYRFRCSDMRVLAARRR
jgi:ubiquinone/menaquinone biosynthesis C-methylase UbiE